MNLSLPNPREFVMMDAMHASSPELAGYPTIHINGRPLPPEAMEFERLRLIRFYREHVSDSPPEAQLRGFRQQAIEQAIGARLLMDEAQRLDIPVTDADIDAQIRKTEAEAGGADALRELLKRQGLELAEFKQQIQRACRVEKLITQAVADAPDPTEAEIRAHYESNRDRYQQAERAQGRHILIKPEDHDPASQRQAQEKLEAIRARIVDGGDFAHEAAAHSDCPSGRQAGGSLGWVARGMMVPAFDAALFALPTGGLSDIIETEFGYHIIHKTDAEAAAPADFEGARESIRNLLRHAARGKALQAFVAELREKADVRIDKNETV